MSKGLIKSTVAAVLLTGGILATATGTATAHNHLGNIDMVKVGQAISLAGIYLPGQMIIASEISVENAAPPQMSALGGTIDSIDSDGNSIVVMGKKIMVVPNTVMEMGKLKGPKIKKVGVNIKGKKKYTRKVLIPSRPMIFSEFKVGMTVSVEGPMNDDGSMEASEIKVSRKKEAEVEIEAEVQAVDPTKNLITVLGIKILVNNRTVIELDE